MASLFLQRSRHQSIYYFRRKVPLELQPVVRQFQIYRTLATSDRKAAIVRARALAARTDAVFEQLRMKRKKQPDELRSDFGFEVELDELFPDRPKRVKFTDVKNDEVAAVTTSMRQRKASPTVTPLGSP